ncbi:hypothetical protein, partial [Alistipes shahii]|uniref:hypothetical protein n=1 Tax=Alistipes shahii TaxID=328814 RepID=UPI00307C91DB
SANAPITCSKRLSSRLFSGTNNAFRQRCAYPAVRKDGRIFRFVVFGCRRGFSAELSLMLRVEAGTDAFVPFMPGAADRAGNIH